MSKWVIIAALALVLMFAMSSRGQASGPVKLNGARPLDGSLGSPDLPPKNLGQASSPSNPTWRGALSAIGAAGGATTGAALGGPVGAVVGGYLGGKLPVAVDAGKKVGGAIGSAAKKLKFW